MWDARALSMTAKMLSKLHHISHKCAKSEGIAVRPSTLKTKIITPRLAETCAFYVTCFGMRVVEEWNEVDDVGCILALASDGREALLELYEGEQSDGFSGLSLQFRTDDLLAFEANLPNSIACRGPVARPWGSNYLYLTDPNGISVIVYDGGL
jgi:catechol 2,3-dioxygenase-like lactoylglutathione lyase family enzyme